jgi:hypothetical protein
MPAIPISGESIIMDIGTALHESFSFATDAVWEKWTRWIILTIMSVIFPLILGYTMEIYRGTVPAPEPENWGKLFVDGLKLLAAAIIYAIPVIIIIVAAFIPVMITIIGSISSGTEFTFNPEELVPLLVPVLGGLILAVVVGIIITLISAIGIIRMARTETFLEAFNFSAIFETIRSIGWGTYILALIVLWIVVFVISIVFGMIGSIPYVGWLIGLFLGVPLTILEARYMNLVYDAGET